MEKTPVKLVENEVTITIDEPSEDKTPEIVEKKAVRPSMADFASPGKSDDYKGPCEKKAKKLVE